MAEYIKNIGSSFGIADWAILIAVCLLVLLLLTKHAKPNMEKLTARDDVRGYSLIYADQKQGGKREEEFGRLMYSAKYALQGKPDYVFQNPMTKRIVPVELKSGVIGEADCPHHGDLMQLGAYFLILEDVYGQKPPFGRLVYQDYMFQVKNTAKLRKEVLGMMQEMREMLEHGVGKAEPSFATCRPCICNGTVCQFSGTEIVKGDEE